MSNEKILISGKCSGLPLFVKLILLTPAAAALVNAVSWVDDVEPYMGFAACLVVALLIINFFKRGEIFVTDKRVYGTVGSKKRVDLPLEKINAVAYGGFKRISVATASGKVMFWNVKNNKEIHKTVCNLLLGIEENETTAE